MFKGGFRPATFVLIALAGVCTGQQHSSGVQSPRQAIIEMVSGGEAAFKKHLTLEMQDKLQDLMKPSVNGAPNPLQVLMSTKSGSDNFQAFDIGPILFSFNNPQQHERYEVQLDSEEPRGDEDVMKLSLHLVRNGIEHEMPVGFQFVTNMKRQENIWRLNTVTFSATLPVGDPRILDKSWWNPALLSASGMAADSAAPSPMVVDERPKMSALRAVRMIGMAENIYAQNHPGIGFTCAISDLVNVGKGMDEDGVYKFMDSAFAGGIYNGYRFTLSGCERKPARTFRVTAEPVAGRGKAYCSDNTSNLRDSEDGRGITCLTSGKIARR
ncbi:MAG TPA: hypothetical protein VFB79_19270 [Candidatus Angelobacter sp.]|nr:hypothetical protein [Candidatus Angelobacter sp.]